MTLLFRRFHVKLVMKSKSCIGIKRDLYNLLNLNKD